MYLRDRKKNMHIKTHNKVMLSALEAETNVPPVFQRNGLRLWGKGGWRAVPVPLENIP